MVSRAFVGRAGRRERRACAIATPSPRERALTAPAPPPLRPAVCAGATGTQVGRDPASRIKFGLTAVLGFTAFLVACVELGKAGEGGTLVRKFDSRVESHAEAGTHMLVATVCPMPFNCPDWCTDDKNDKGPKKYYCKCVDNKSTMEWKFAPNNKGDHMCQFIEEATPGHKAPKMHPVAVHKAADKVPVTLWDGYALEQEHCQQVNWVMNETQRSRDQFIVCSFHSNLHPDDEPYPTALLDMKGS